MFRIVATPENIALFESGYDFSDQIPRNTNTYKVRLLHCASCNTTYLGRYGKTKTYCSRDCFKSRPSKIVYGTTVCNHCSSEFTHKINQKKMFCNLTCQIAWQGRNKTSHNCEHCGKIFRWSPSRAASTGHNIRFCSQKCYTESGVRLQNVVMNCQKQRNNQGPNKLEILGYSFLDSLGVDYKKEVPLFGKFVVDVLVGTDKVIQFDGDYWHGKHSSEEEF